MVFASVITLSDSKASYSSNRPTRRLTNLVDLSEYARLDTSNILVDWQVAIHVSA